MFTKTTIVLLGLFVACEVCTLIVFCYQRTVRKLAMRLNIAQSKLVFCYPKWMLTMYKGTFLKFGIILALFIIEWRCALVSLGIFALFFFLSCVIIVPDGGNLIRIRHEVKRCGRGTIGITTYQVLMTEIEKGIVATGGDLTKIDADEQKQTEWGLPFKRQENLEWAGGKNKVKDKVKPQDNIVRTWENAPASIKGAVIAIGLVFGGMSLLVGVTIGKMTPLLVLVLLLIFAWLGFWIYQILRGKNWTRVFAIVLVLQVILFSINNILMGGAFDFSSTVGGASIALIIAALLFCPGANKWFVSWPRWWSYWPVSLIIPAMLNLMNPQMLSDTHIPVQGSKHGEISVKRMTKAKRSVTTMGDSNVMYDISKLSDTELQKIIDTGGKYDPFVTRRVQVTRARLRHIEKNIMDIKTRTGTYPTDMAKLRQFYGANNESYLHDEWGTEIYYETDGNDFGLLSAGPDKKWGTEDDIIIINEGLKRNIFQKNTNESGDANMAQVQVMVPQQHQSIRLKNELDSAYYERIFVQMVREESKFENVDFSDVTDAELCSLYRAYCQELEAKGKRNSLGFDIVDDGIRKWRVLEFLIKKKKKHNIEFITC